MAQDQRVAELKRRAALAHDSAYRLERQDSVYTVGAGSELEALLRSRDAAMAELRSLVPDLAANWLDSEEAREAIRCPAV